MDLKVLQFRIVFLIILLNKTILSQPLSKEEEAEHLDNRLKHYLQRIELLVKKSNVKFHSELQNLMEKFKNSLVNDSFKDKLQLLETHTELQDVSEYLAKEFDKQYINEDILIECWYLNEILPHLGKDLYDEVVQVLHNLKEAYRAEDLEEKFNIYSDIGEKLSEQFLDYFYGENEPLPLMNAQLKYYYEYTQFLMNEFKTVAEEFQPKLRDLSAAVEGAMKSDDKVAKQKIIDFFDDLTTKFGRFLDEHFVDFKMFKFGE